MSVIKEVINNKLYLSDIKGLNHLDQIPELSHILTLTSAPINTSTLPQNITHKFLETHDVEEERLLDKFPEIIDFYEKSDCLLIHCQQGVSRSVAAVSAIIMKIKELSQQQTFEHLNTLNIQTDKVIDGFIVQLKLFEKLEFQVNRTHPDYRFWRFSILNLGYNSGGLSYNDILWSSVSDKTESKIIYRCSKCRQRLFKKSHLVIEDVSNYFLHPVDWMRDMIIDCGQTGKLLCPKCSQKLGHFSWYGECNVSTGEWLCPVFNISSKKVDKINM